MRNISRGARLPILFIFLFQVLSPLLLAEPLSLKRAVELAISHGEVVGASKDDEQRAFATYLETKDQFVPQIAVGSGLGSNLGIPVEP